MAQRIFALAINLDRQPLNDVKFQQSLCTLLGTLGNYTTEQLMKLNPPGGVLKNPKGEEVAAFQWKVEE